MIVICSLYIVCVLFAYAIETTSNEQNRNILIFACLLILTFVSGTRLVGGMDYPSYELLYQLNPTFPSILNPENQNPNYETGYLYLCSFFKTIGISFYGFCIIHSAFIYYCLWKGMSYFTRHFGLVILVFLYKLMFYNTMISMRQSITIAMFILMVPMIVEKKWVKYYIMAYIASRFHNGAYLLFILYPLRYIKLTKKRITVLNIIFLPTMAIGFLGIDVLGPIGDFLKDNATSASMAGKSENYFNSENLSPIGIFHTVEYYIMMGVLYYILKKINLTDSKTHMVIWMFLCLLPLFTLFRGSEILTREKDYFTIFYAVILGYTTNIHPKAKLLIFVIVSMICGFGYYRYVLLFDNGHFLNYSSWLFEPGYSFFE